MLQLWEDRALCMRVLETMTWPYKVPTNEEGKAKPHAC